MDDKTCIYCQAVYSKRKNESVERFACRKYCGKPCFRQARAAVRAKFGDIRYQPSYNDAEALKEP